MAPIKVASLSLVALQVIVLGANFVGAAAEDDACLPVDQEASSVLQTHVQRSVDAALPTNAQAAASPVLLSELSSVSTRSGTLEKPARTHICNDDGAALPVLMTGVQKSGSSTTYDDLIETLWMRQDINCDASMGNSSTKGFWECKEPHLLAAGFNPAVYSKAWGSCDQPREGLIADFTPEIFYTPRIQGRILQVYGEEKSKEIVFLMGLRQPLKRMLSAFVNGLHDGWIYHHKRPDMTFEIHVAEFLADWDKNGGTDWISSLWQVQDYRTIDQGLYYYKIKNFLDAGFLPSQFVVYPGEEYLKNRANLDTNPVLEAVRERLGDSVLRPTRKNVENVADNRGSYRPLSESLSNTALRTRMEEEVFGPANQLLMELLANMSAQGATLVGYTGKARDVAAVKQWMESQWDF